MSLEPSLNGLPGVRGESSALPVVYGSTSTRGGGVTRSIPTRSTNRETNPLPFLGV